MMREFFISATFYKCSNQVEISTQFKVIWHEEGETFKEAFIERIESEQNSRSCENYHVDAMCEITKSRRLEQKG